MRIELLFIESLYINSKKIESKVEIYGNLIGGSHCIVLHNGIFYYSSFSYSDYSLRIFSNIGDFVNTIKYDREETKVRATEKMTYYSTMSNDVYKSLKPYVLYTNIR